MNPAETAEIPRRSRRPSTSALDFYYGQKRALESITLGIRPNLVTAFIGPSGCGKSTLLRTLMHDIIPGTRVEGSVLIDGNDIYAPSSDVVRLRRRVGMVFQKSNPFPKSIFENVAYGLRINGLTRDRSTLQARVEDSLEAAALWDDVKTASTNRRWRCRATSSSGCASPGRWRSSRRSC